MTLFPPERRFRLARLVPGSGLAAIAADFQAVGRDIAAAIEHEKKAQEKAYRC